MRAGSCGQARPLPEASDREDPKSPCSTRQPLDVAGVASCDDGFLKREGSCLPDAADAASVTGNAGQGGQLELVFSEGPDAEERDDDTPKPRKPWAWLLRHVFQADLERCPRCDGAMRWVHAATTQKDIARLLAEHGLGPRAPPPAIASPPGQLRLAFTHP